jgi:hypothetical protein
MYFNILSIVAVDGVSFASHFFVQEFALKKLLPQLAVVFVVLVNQFEATFQSEPSSLHHTSGCAITIQFHPGTSGDTH